MNRTRIALATAAASVFIFGTGFAAGRITAPESYIEMHSDAVLSRTVLYNVPVRIMDAERVSIIDSTFNFSRPWVWSPSYAIYARDASHIQVSGNVISSPDPWWLNVKYSLITSRHAPPCITINETEYKDCTGSVSVP